MPHKSKTRDHRYLADDFFEPVMNWIGEFDGAPITSGIPYAKEHKTMSLILPRRSGKTTLAMDVFENYNALLITLTYNEADMLIKSFPSLIHKKDNIMTKHTYQRRAIGLISPVVVVVDEISFWEKEEKEELYEIFHNKAGCFLFLGSEK